MSLLKENKNRGLSSPEDEKLVAYVDQQVNRTLANNKNPIEIFLVLGNRIEDITKLVNALSKEELDRYCETYEGFCLFLIFLDELALEISSGRLSIPSYH